MRVGGPSRVARCQPSVHLGVDARPERVVALFAGDVDVAAGGDVIESGVRGLPEQPELLRLRGFALLEKAKARSDWRSDVRRTRTGSVRIPTPSTGR